MLIRFAPALYILGILITGCGLLMLCRSDCHG